MYTGSEKINASTLLARMSSGGEIIQVEFHNKASEIFFTFFNAFEKEVSAIDRNKQEFDFQKLKKEYVASFERELHSTAKTILTRHKTQLSSPEIDPMIRHFITDYLHRFVQKVNDL
jgi:hypothetical protein